MNYLCLNTHTQTIFKLLPNVSLVSRFVRKRKREASCNTLKYLFLKTFMKFIYGLTHVNGIYVNVSVWVCMCKSNSVKCGISYATNF